MIYLASFVLALALLFCCGLGSQVHEVEWTIDGVRQYRNTPLRVFLGDTVLFLCANDSLSNIVYQSVRLQYDNCNVTASSGASRKIGECLQAASRVGAREEIKRSSETLPNAISYEAGVTVYFTSYSDGSFDSAVRDVTAGGECVDGLKMEISINSEVTEMPSVTDSTDNQSTTDTGGVEGDGGGSSLSIGIIIGIAAGGAVAIVVVCVCVVVLCCAIAFTREKKSMCVKRVTPEPPDKLSKVEQGTSISSIQVTVLGNEEIRDAKEAERIKRLDAKEAERIKRLDAKEAERIKQLDAKKREKEKAIGVSSRVEVARYDVPQRSKEKAGSVGGGTGGVGGKAKKEDSRAPQPKATATALAETKKGPGSKPRTTPPPPPPPSQSSDETTAITVLAAGGTRSNPSVSYKPQPSPPRRNTTTSFSQRPPPPSKLTKKASLDSSGEAKRSVDGTDSQPKEKPKLPFKPLAQRGGDNKPSNVRTKPGTGAQRAASTASDMQSVQRAGTGSDAKPAAGKPPSSGMGKGRVTTQSQRQGETGKTQAQKPLKANHSVPVLRPERQDSAPTASATTPTAGPGINSVSSLPVMARRVAPPPPPASTGKQLPPLRQPGSKTGGQQGGAEKERKEKAIKEWIGPLLHTPASNGVTSHRSK